VGVANWVFEKVIKQKDKHGNVKFETPMRLKKGKLKKHPALATSLCVEDRYILQRDTAREI
jgi:hypothetical protein